MNRSLLLAGIISTLACNTAWSNPIVDISTSSEALEKGHTSQIFVEIKSTEALNDIVISIAEPEGFTVEALESPGITLEKESETNLHSVVRIAGLGGNSGITAAFKVWAPDLSGNPRTGDKQSLYSTREPKVFPINVLYTTDGDSGEIAGMYTERLTIPYSTSIGHYLAAGLFGVLLGFIVKISTQYKQEISETIKGRKTIPEKTAGFLFELLVARLPLLLTLLIVGFGVLLTLARDGLPITSWHQAIALGIGIGVLSDEQLITKVKQYKF